jgi:hypothetical protein
MSNIFKVYQMDNSGVTYNLPGTVSGVFFTKKDADAAYHALLKRGHSADDISVLMSDETLDNHRAIYADEDFDKNDEASMSSKARDTIVNAIISISPMISLPGLGISISKRLFKKMEVSNRNEERSLDRILASEIPEPHTQSYRDSMREGGIIISVDPRNSDEKSAIVKEFIENNGHDILGDDGYTELG